MKQSFNLEDNYIYQEMIKWEVEKRFKQGLEQSREQEKKSIGRTLVRFVELYFPDLVLLTKKQVEQADNAQHLQDLLYKLFMVHSDEVAKAVLLNEQVSVAA